MGFKATNNETEYESLLIELRVAMELRVNSLDTFNNYQLVVNQVQGDYLAKNTRMLAYLDEVNNVFRNIKDFKIHQIPREDNEKADALANLALTFDFVLDRSIPLEFLLNPSIEVARLVCQIEAGPTWMDNIITYLQNGTLPLDKL